MSSNSAPRSLTRREVFRRIALAGLGVPALAALMAACGPQAPLAPVSAAAPTLAPTVAPTVAAATRGGGGALRLLWWQAPTNLNSHLSLATKDVGAIRIYAEPLADFDASAQLVPVLAAEIPSVENGGVAKDFRSVTWKLKKGVTWHDGQPFTAADVAFTFKFLSDPATGATTLGYYQSVAAVEAPADERSKLRLQPGSPRSPAPRARFCPSIC